MTSRLYGRKDGNQNEIEQALTVAGYKVKDCSKFGFGFPDLHVMSKYRRDVFMEVKQPGGKLSDAEKKWMEWHTGYHFVVFSAEEAIDYMRDVDEEDE